jgi:hypothetical protein
MTLKGKAIFGVIYYDEKGYPRPVVNSDGTLKHFYTIELADAEADEFQETVGFETVTVSLSPVEDEATIKEILQSHLGAEQTLKNHINYCPF